MSGPPESGKPARGDWVGWLERRFNVTELFSFLAHFGLVYTPIDSNKPIRQTLREVAETPVPAYARWPRVLGLLAAVLFGLQAITGVLLACYYRPTPEDAFSSTRLIARDLPFGWFIHQMHAWGAYLLLGVVILRLFRLFWQGLFRFPRELLWVSAAVMAWVVAQLDFTGRLLPWDAHAYWSVVRGFEVIQSQPIIGPILAFVSGGKVVNEDVLIRFYVLHMLVLPILFVGCLYITFATLRKVGLSPEGGSTGPTTTFRAHFFSTVILSVLTFALLVSLAVLLPFPFLSPADPYATPAVVRPPWYLLAPYALLEHLPGPHWIAGGLIAIAGLVLTALPLWFRDADAGRAIRRARIWGVAAIVVWIVLTVVGVLQDRA